MKIYYFILVFAFLLEFSAAQDIMMNFGEYNPEEGSLEIWIDTEVNIYGCQLTVTGFNVTDAVPGEALTSQGYMLSFNSSGLLLAFGFEPPILLGHHLFCTLYFDEITAGEACFEDLHFGGWDGQALLDFSYDDCLSTGLCGLMGDLNGDSNIDVLDLVLTVNCILSGSGCPCADVNADDVVDVSDIVAMITEILSG